MLRIVSLIASATEIVASLGLTRYQVGRSHECDFPPEILALPVCTSPAFITSGSSDEIDQRVKKRVADALSLYEVSRELLDQLQPTYVITQTQCRVCSVSLDDVERALSGRMTSRPKLIALEPNALADVWSDIRTVGMSCGVPAGKKLSRRCKPGCNGSQNVPGRMIDGRGWRALNGISR